MKNEKTFISPFPQEFSFPSNILYYVSRYPTFPNGHLKLISSCKSPNDASTLIKHIHKCLLRELTLFNQVFTFEELQFLVSGGHLEYVYFDKNVVKNSNGSITEFEKVFQLLCCEELTIRLPDKDNGFGRDTTKKIIEVVSSDRIPVEQYIRLWNLPQDFDFHLFSNFLLANMSGRQHAIHLSFSDKISDLYKNQLQEFVYKIIQIRGIYAHTVPRISFTGQNKEAKGEIWKMQYKPVEGILRKYGPY